MKFSYWLLYRDTNGSCENQRSLSRSEAARLLCAATGCVRAMQGWAREYEIVPGVSLQITLSMKEV